MPLPAILSEVPDFTCDALYPDKEIRPLSLSSYRGKWVVFFWYPKDFTFVCPTEITAFGDRQPEFEKANCQVIAASCDNEFTHLAWVNTARSNGGLGPMKIPIVADFSKEIATKYGVLHTDGVPFRTSFIISPTGVLRQITMNDNPVGRNVDETLRLVKAYQYTDEHGEVCPANWQPGDKTMVADPKLSKAYFSTVADPGLPAAAGGLEEVSDMDKFTSVTKGSGLTVVDFWAPWCKNCGKMMPAVTKLAGEMTGAKFIKVNTVEAESIAMANEVTALPTFVFFKGGAKVGAFTGSSVDGLKAAISKCM